MSTDNVPSVRVLRTMIVVVATLASLALLGVVTILNRSLANAIVQPDPEDVWSTALLATLIEVGAVLVPILLGLCCRDCLREWRRVKDETRAIIDHESS